MPIATWETSLGEQGRLDEAADCFQRALELKPDHAEIYNNLGNLFRVRRMLDAAVACGRKAVDLKPDFVEAYHNLGNALREQGRLEEAIACCRRAVELKPDLPDAHIGLGAALREQGLLNEAVACCRRAIELKPDFADAHSNLGVALYNQGRLDEAVACHRTVLSLQPHSSEGHFNLAMSPLARGDMAAGWQEFEWRWKTAQMMAGRRDFAQPQWRGEPAAGLTLLIHAEQGFGDTLQFCRYAPLAASAGLRVVIEAPKPLVRLLRSLPGVDLVLARGEELPAFDLHCPMLSLPLALGTTLASIPARWPICTLTRRWPPPGTRGLARPISRGRGSAWSGQAIPVTIHPSSRLPIAGAHWPRIGWHRCLACPVCSSSACKKTDRQRPRTSR